VQGPPSKCRPGGSLEQVGSSAPRSVGWRCRLVFLCVLAAVLSPLLTNHDSFPLSTYPMYAGSAPRLDHFLTVVGVDDAGTIHTLSLSTIARTDDPLIAESLIHQAVRGGWADALCTEVAGRVGPEAASVEVVDELHDVVAKARGKSSLRDRAVVATCQVRQ
jgi:hypothetical protein